MSSYLLNTLPTNACIQLMQAACVDTSVTFTVNTNQNQQNIYSYTSLFACF